MAVTVSSKIQDETLDTFFHKKAILEMTPKLKRFKNGSFQHTNTKPDGFWDSAQNTDDLF